MLTLALDTSTKTTSVAILNNQSVLFEAVLNTGAHHSEALLPLIRKACDQTKIRINDFDLFACTIGPGSFTGLRIGLGTIKGFVFASGKSAVGVSSLAALALNVEKNSKFICPMMDAGRGQVYSAYFRYLKDGRIKQVTSERVAHPQEVAREAKEETVFVGNGAVIYSDVLKKTTSRGCLIASSANQFIRASLVGLLGIQKFHAHEMLDVEKCGPLYLRLEDALIRKKIF
ncbi:MAG TPA: tRNA (adenosine(37)-N6)-threonylcarbamoyltransferase complex dimerization subunit type 1 TsaB [Smithella sp.]|nr:tRNA (adenosine(37)-N6)-threonylcarbamoyltransferase complex dimerization subunit type 1 TsaB [Smithella sp.]HRS97895.1 tRNA (adenosine(37)-N6)-threonylcarbamoyltransferase complex dimerization subunit type 1 TsaB [Smithella sp.]